MRLLFNIENRENIEILLIKNKRSVNRTRLTVGQGFDIILIGALDKILHRNRIEKTSLKSIRISGKMATGAISGMILKTITEALII